MLASNFNVCEKHHKALSPESLSRMVEMFWPSKITTSENCSMCTCERIKRRTDKWIYIPERIGHYPDGKDGKKRRK